MQVFQNTVPKLWTLPCILYDPQIAPERGKHMLPSEDLPETFRLPSEEIGNIFWEKNLLLEGVGAWRAGLAVAGLVGRLRVRQQGRSRMAAPAVRKFLLQTLTGQTVSR